METWATTVVEVMGWAGNGRRGFDGGMKDGDTRHSDGDDGHESQETSCMKQDSGLNAWNFGNVTQFEGGSEWSSEWETWVRAWRVGDMGMSI